MTTKLSYIKLFADCIPVRGASRGIICDLLRNLHIFVPLSLIDLFDENYMFHREKMEKQLDVENKKVLSEYLELLEKHEFIFRCHKNEAKKFPLLNMEWDFPSEVTNIIIDIDKNSDHDYNKILNDELDEVNCRFLQFRRYDESDINFWQCIMAIINKSHIMAVEIVMKDSPDMFSHKELCSWVLNNRKIRTVTLHGSIENKFVQPSNGGFSLIMAIKEYINNETHCGVINPKYFIHNIETFTESQQFNTCLNRKISISAKGEIKNCPSMVKTYGNIQNTKLIDVIKKPEFQKVWNIKKEEIAKCKDCEFKHICTDCRAYLDNPNDIYSAPLKCGYNPYTCTWEEWSTNPLKEKAIEFYNIPNSAEE